ncbi:hypothetical protein DQW50_16180 [Halorubrum sp. 48-1-W]|uniref:hypothetical protein n=1 Tax=Halorubrum sp. 48-1-W TaxID=2249761 RepID=UPI000DCF01CA|nr:hypothetical protein [Halorubrum sp. 48-1-W]RAW44062.1 hypothetical protein DQW50_16180 [Halorubrum sp. 48-1-W]
MRGIATVIVVAFSSIVMFGIVAPSILEPVAEIFVQDQAVQNSQIDAQGFVDSLFNSIFKWAVLVVLGSGVISAVVFYFRRERRRVRRRV